MARLLIALALAATATAQISHLDDDGLLRISPVDTQSVRIRNDNGDTLNVEIGNDTIYTTPTDTVVVHNDSLPVKYSAGKIRTSSQPYTYDIAEGNVTDHYSFFVHGVNASVGTDEESVNPTSTGYQKYLSGAQQIRIAADSTRDSIAGVGARSVAIYGLDSTWAEQAETLDMDGVTGPLSTGYYIRLTCLQAVTTGDSATNLGNIYAKDSAGTTTLLQMTRRRGRAHHGIWTVPVGKTAYITTFFGSEGSNKGSRIDLYVRPFGDGWYNPIGTAIFNGFASLGLGIPYQLPAKTDIEFRATAVQAGAVVTAGLEGWYEDN